MKKIFILGLLLLPCLAYAGPSIYFENEMHNFGQVLPGEQLEATFEFWNAGSEDLIIKGLHST